MNTEKSNWKLLLEHYSFGVSLLWHCSFYLPLIITELCIPLQRSLHRDTGFVCFKTWALFSNLIVTSTGKSSTFGTMASRHQEMTLNWIPSEKANWGIQKRPIQMLSAHTGMQGITMRPHQTKTEPNANCCEVVKHISSSLTGCSFLRNCDYYFCSVFCVTIMTHIVKPAPVCAAQFNCVSLDPYIRHKKLNFCRLSLRSWKSRLFIV